MTDFGGDDFGLGLTVQRDGKVIVAGARYISATNLYAVAIARYNTNGTLDKTFGRLLASGLREGKRVFSIVSGVTSIALDVVVQSDGRIVAGGATDDGSGVLDFALVRLKSNGVFDASFGEGGKVTVDFGNSEFSYAIVQQPDGKYVLGGLTDDGTQSDFALARVLP
jgi:uncharacterized delta-60 repeat protein